MMNEVNENRNGIFLLYFVWYLGSCAFFIGLSRLSVSLNPSLIIPGSVIILWIEALIFYKVANRLFAERLVNIALVLSLPVTVGGSLLILLLYIMSPVLNGD